MCRRQSRGRPPIAEEAAQDAFVEAHAALGSFLQRAESEYLLQTGTTETKRASG